MTIYTLYVKTHTITGLKYLGYTSKADPHKYRGSGVYWTRHLKVHGNDYTTEVLQECQSKEEVKKYGIHYSNRWNVVASDKWANLKPEEGEGGSGSKGYKHTVESITKQKETRKQNNAIRKQTWWKS